VKLGYDCFLSVEGKIASMASIRATEKSGIYYGWIILIAGVVIGFISFGIRYSFGVFFNSFEAEFDLSRTATSGIFSLYMLLTAVVSIVGGWASDKYGPKKVAQIMCICTGSSLLLSSQASALWQLYITYSVLLAMGTGAIVVIANATTSRWFLRRRGLTVGITSSAGAIGGIILVPFAALLLSYFDWRMSFIILGAMALIILIPCSQLLKKDPSVIGLMSDGVVPRASPAKALRAERGYQHDGLSLSESYKTRQFWFIGLVGLFLTISVQMILAHVVPHATDLGISMIDAAFIISLIGVGAILGRLTYGRISDTIGRKAPAIASAVIQVVALISLIFIRQLWMFYVFGLFFGYGWGSLGAQGTLMIGDIFGLRAVGANMGATTTAWHIGAAIGPALGGIVFDATGSYSPAFAMAAFGMLLATIFNMLINPIKAEDDRDQLSGQ
jgi:MFS family permease